MSDQYGHKNKSRGRSASINKHPGSDKAGASEEPFSVMKQVDNAEHHQKSIKNMSAIPGHVKVMGIDKNHAYAKQSHAVKPAGPINSFVGNRVDGNYTSAPSVKKPDAQKGFYKKG